MFDLRELLWLQNYWFNIFILLGGLLTILILFVSIIITLSDTSDDPHISETGDDHV